MCACQRKIGRQVWHNISSVTSEVLGKQDSKAFVMEWIGTSSFLLDSIVECRAIKLKATEVHERQKQTGVAVLQCFFDKLQAVV